MNSFTTPIVGLIAGEPYQEDYRMFLNRAAGMLDRCVSMGTHVIARCDAKGGDEHDTVPPLLLLDVLENLDGVSNLVRLGSSNPCNLLLRCMTEAKWGLQYLFENNYKPRSTSYLVAHMRSKLSYYRRINPSTNEGKLFQKQMNAAGMGIIVPEFEASKAIANAEQWLERAEYKPTSQEFIQTKKRNRGRTPQWYSLYAGPSSIANLATHLGAALEYENLYRFWSGSVHVSDAINRLSRSESGGPAYLPIRYPKQLQSSVVIAVSCALASMRVVMSNRSPEMEKEFNEWYVEHIRNDFLDFATKKLLSVN